MAFSFSRTTVSRSFFPRRGIAVALLAGSFAASAAFAQQAPAPAGTTEAAPATTQDQTPTAVLSNTAPKKGRSRKSDETKKDAKVVQSKDTVKDQQKLRKQLKLNPLGNVKSDQPDKQLYDKAQIAINKGRYEVARLDLQTLLSTYPDSEYQMRAKLAFADSWYREGGSGPLAQAETEYHDFIIFFPNAPEAAEAQMRIGDIYFKQMDRPDRDYAKAVHAQDEYRTMLTQYPDSPLIPEAKQHLREVQEVMAQRESDIAQFYAGHENWVAAIARFQTVVDTYPLYSHIDQTLIGLGDAYSAQSRFVRTLNLPEEAKARLLSNYDGMAIAAYSRVATQYAASPHVEDARDRLAAMNVPIPQPTAEQLAASQALEDSRQTYNLANRAKGLIFRGPDTVQTARIGDPSLADPKTTTAPAVANHINDLYRAAVDPKSVASKPVNAAVAGTPAEQPADTAVGASAPVGTPSLQDIPSSDTAPATAGSTFTSAPAGATPTSTGGNSVGVTILSPGATNGTPDGSAPASTAPAGSTTPPNYGFAPVGPKNTVLPPIEKAGDAPDAVNDVAGQKTPEGETPTLDKKGNIKKTKPAFDKGEESSSTHKKKKGLKKINPF
jgi:outer membrane protein assembly factor BamD